MAFDTNQGFAVPIRREAGLTKVLVRWPTDEEWIERSKGWRITMHRLGRGITETKVESEQADLRLYLKIREEDSPELNADEAKVVVDTISRCDINDVQLDQDEAEVEMTLVNGLKVTHTLRIPTSAEVTQFKRASARVMDLPHNVQQIRTNLQAGASLWDKCHVAHGNYTNGVPITHRDAAVRAVIDACERAVEATADEDF